jgi:hypothetical protein
MGLLYLYLYPVSKMFSCNLTLWEFCREKYKFDQRFGVRRPLELVERLAGTDISCNSTDWTVNLQERVCSILYSPVGTNVWFHLLRLAENLVSVLVYITAKLTSCSLSDFIPDLGAISSIILPKLHKQWLHLCASMSAVQDRFSEKYSI